MDSDDPKRKRGNRRANRESTYLHEEVRNNLKELVRDFPILKSKSSSIEHAVITFISLARTFLLDMHGYPDLPPEWRERLPPEWERKNIKLYVPSRASPVKHKGRSLR